MSSHARSVLVDVSSDHFRNIPVYQKINQNSAQEHVLLGRCLLSSELVGLLVLFDFQPSNPGTTPFDQPALLLLLVLPLLLTLRKFVVLLVLGDRSHQLTAARRVPYQNMPFTELLSLSMVDFFKFRVF